VRGPHDAPKLPPGVGRRRFDFGSIGRSAHNTPGGGDEWSRAMLVVLSTPPEMPFPVLFADEFTTLRTDRHMKSSKGILGINVRERV